ncbi:MAG: hypothetical protein M1820_007005 [Bogoriella megaspora]|nr:MAG: hypothetical protein M1820_007005 [Bogoriella megaspora]
MGQASSSPSGSLLADSESHRINARLLRDQADTEFKASIKAWNTGDRSSSASHKARRIRLQQDAAALDKKAADMAFRYHNPEYEKQDEDLGLIDLHGLYAGEAIERVKAHIVKAKRRAIRKGMRGECVKIITGSGNRSRNGVAVLKPKVEEWCRAQGLWVEHPRNKGVLLVYFDVTESWLEKIWGLAWLWSILGGGLGYWLVTRKWSK